MNHLAIFLLRGIIMKPIDILLLAGIIAYCVYVLYKEYRKKKVSKCTGICTGCTAGSCKIDFDKIYRQIKEDERREQNG